MFYLKRTHKKLFAILLGIFVIAGMRIITNLFYFFVVSDIARITPVSEFKIALSQSPVPELRLLTGIISLIALVLGGYIVGRRIKEKGWLYGGLLGVVLELIFIAISFLPALIPTSYTYGPGFPANFGYEVARKAILNQLTQAPITIILTSLGGLLGQKLFNKQLSQ